MSAIRLRLTEASFHERPVKLRLPFRFGVVTLTQAPQAFVRATVRLADGREGEGVAAELLVPKWFDKAPALTNEDNFDQLRRSLAIARRQVLAAGTHTAFGLSAAVEAAQHAACAQAGLNGLVASFGLALIERAIIDALGRLERASVFDLVRGNSLGLTAATAPDLAGFDLDRFLASLRPAPSIFARHTVGLLDTLTRADTAGRRLDDGLPESLEEVIAVYGHRHFKLKVAGFLDADIDRLARIAAVLDGLAEPYFATLDGNEQFEHVDAVIALWRRIGADPRLARLNASILFVEQPIARAKALAEPVHALAREVPIEIDESDADIGVFPAARQLGYRGISAKSCKGFYRALLNRARIARWNAEEGGERYFMSAEDLTTQAGVAVQQDLALAALVGATHVERNGHHYVDGMAGAPEQEQSAFLMAHPELYRRSDAALASEASGQRGHSISARAGHSPEPGSSARAALASEASGQRGHSISARAGHSPEPGSSARAALASEASGQRGHSISARAGYSPEPGSSARGRVRLHIANGALALSSLAATPGLAVGVTPDWSAMQPMPER